MTALFQSIPPRPAPFRTQGLRFWLKTNLFNSPLNIALTTVILLIIGYNIQPFLSWFVINSVVSVDADACQLARGAGACWGGVVEKWRVIIFGFYPQDELWRPELATLLLISLLAASCVNVFWNRWLIVAWIVVTILFFWLMGGGFGLTEVQSNKWGGLPLTIMLATYSISLSFPLGVILALGRMSNLPTIKSICVVFIELIRGIPLISVLFMASFLFPLFMPIGTSPDVLIRVLVGLTLFSAAYLAEVVRGGLQAIPKGQVEASGSLGLSYWQMQRKIILPQALTMVIPGIINSFISMFKDTSLVTIVSLYELLGATRLAFYSDANWRPFIFEGFMFIALLYFIFCFSMSRYSLYIEKLLYRSKKR